MKTLQITLPVILLAALLLGCRQTPDAPAGPAYTVESIDTPHGLQPENGGLEFLPDGRLVALFRRGEVMIYDPQTETWDLFAKGLHDPLGVKAISNSEILVMQRPELTRLVDTNGDGMADLYETITDDFGLTGNYAEFAFGPEITSDGDYFIALMTGSALADVRPIMRGEFNEYGRRGRMYSAAPYRGWIMRVQPDGTTIPWASGVRSPNGLVLDDDGNLFVTDNQGDWLGTSKLYHIKKDHFYGHPPSLAWLEGMDGQPLDIPVAALDLMRTKGIIKFPQGIFMNSPTQPIIDRTGGKFGPFEGQMFVGEMNHDRIGRIMLEEVQGEFQGATVSFIDSTGLRMGNNRLAFSPDGDLWVGQTAQGWAGALGVQKISWNGNIPMEVYTMSLTEDGFDLTFTKPVDPETAVDPGNYFFERYYYRYQERYGSARYGLEEIGVTDATLSGDGKTVSLTLEKLDPDFIYDLQISDISARESGNPLVNSRLFYTLNNLR